MSTNNSTMTTSQSAQGVQPKRKASDGQSKDGPVQKQVKIESFGPPPIHPHQHMFRPSTNQQPQAPLHQAMYQGQQGAMPQAGQQQPSQQAPQQPQPQQLQQRGQELTAQQYVHLRSQLANALTGPERDNFLNMINTATNVLNEKGPNAPETISVQQRLNQVTKSLWVKYRSSAGSSLQGSAGNQGQGARPTAGSPPAGQVNQFVPPPNLSAQDLQRWKDMMNNKLKQMAQRLQAIRAQMAHIQQLMKSPDSGGHDPVKLRTQLETYAKQYKLYKEWIDNFKAASMPNSSGPANAQYQGSSAPRVVSVTAGTQDGADANNVINKQAPSAPPTTPSQQQEQQQQVTAQPQQQQPQQSQVQVQQQPVSQQQQAVTGVDQTNNQQAQPTLQPLQQPKAQQLQQQQQQAIPQNTQPQPNQKNITNRGTNGPPAAGWSSMSPTTANPTPQQSPVQQHESPTQMSPQLSQQGRPPQPSTNSGAQAGSPVPGTPGGPAQTRDGSVPPRAGSSQPMTRPPTATQQPQQAPQQQSAPRAVAPGVSVQSPSFSGHSAQSQQLGSGKMPVPKTLNPTPLTPAPSHPIRPSLSGGMNSAGSHVMGTPALVKNPTFELDESGLGLLSKRKLEELVKQIDPDEKLDPEVEECVLELVDEFIDTATTYACKMAKLRGSDTLDIKDIQIVLERNWNIRIPGYAADEIRTVRKFIPAQAYMQKMSALAAGKALNQSTAKGET